MTHPLAAPVVKAAARDTGAKGKDSLERDTCSHIGTGACRFVPLSHETLGRAGPAAFALLNDIAGLAASSGVVPRSFLGERHARPVYDPVPRDHAASASHSAAACPPERTTLGRGTACADRRPDPRRRQAILVALSPSPDHGVPPSTPPSPFPPALLGSRSLSLPPSLPPCDIPWTTAPPLCIPLNRKCC